MLPSRSPGGIGSEARIAGLALGAAIAAKLFVWPLVVWLLLTRRYRAAGVGGRSAVVLVVGAWALSGSRACATIRAPASAVQDVYASGASRSRPWPARLGASVPSPSRVAGPRAGSSLGVAAWLVRRGDGDRRAFAVVVVACVVALADRLAQLRRAPASSRSRSRGRASRRRWFFGYAIWVVGVFAPKPDFVDPKGRPHDVPIMAWAWSHSDPLPWYAVGILVIVLLVDWDPGGRRCPRRAPKAAAQGVEVRG